MKRRYLVIMKRRWDSESEVAHETHSLEGALKVANALFRKYTIFSCEVLELSREFSQPTIEQLYKIESLCKHSAVQLVLTEDSDVLWKCEQCTSTISKTPATLTLNEISA